MLTGIVRTDLGLAEVTYAEQKECAESTKLTRAL